MSLLPPLLLPDVSLPSKLVLPFKKDAKDRLLIRCSTPLAVQVQGSLLPVLANLAGDSDANIRDAAQGAMVVFAVKAGSMAVLDKVRLCGVGDHGV